MCFIIFESLVIKARSLVKKEYLYPKGLGEMPATICDSILNSSSLVDVYRLPLIYIVALYGNCSFGKWCFSILFRLFFHYNTPLLNYLIYSNLQTN